MKLSLAFLFTVLVLVPEDSHCIIGGVKAVIANYPYMVSLKIDGSPFGAGVILNNQWILTTAFNVKWYQKLQLEFRIGTNMLDGAGQVVEVDKVVVHENYMAASDWDYDIALVKVKSPMTFGKKINKIGISTEDISTVPQAYVLGWGQGNQTVIPSQFLLRTRVPLLNYNSCKSIYSIYGTELSQNSYCSQNGNYGPCYYDYGGPMIHNEKLVGLFSGSKNCLPGYLPLIYTNVVQLNSWIQSQIKN